MVSNARVTCVEFSDLTISPVHMAAAGLVHPSRGISMRFPRFLQVRTDKNTEDASGPSEIAQLFHKQTRKLDVGADKGTTHKPTACLKEMRDSNVHEGEGDEVGDEDSEDDVGGDREGGALKLDLEF